MVRTENTITLIPEWITIPEVAAMCKELVGQMWMQNDHVQVSAAAVNMPWHVRLCASGNALGEVLDGSRSGIDLPVNN